MAQGWRDGLKDDYANKIHRKAAGDSTERESSVSNSLREIHEYMYWHLGDDVKAPTYGEDATGGSAYVSVVAKPTSPRVYTHLKARCSTQDALLSLDSGTTAHIPITAGDAFETFNGLRITQAVFAKNKAAGSNYVALDVIVW